MFRHVFFVRLLPNCRAILAVRPHLLPRCLTHASLPAIAQPNPSQTDECAGHILKAFGNALGTALKTSLAVQAAKKTVWATSSRTAIVGHTRSDLCVDWVTPGWKSTALASTERRQKMPAGLASSSPNRGTMWSRSASASLPTCAGTQVLNGLVYPTVYLQNRKKERKQVLARVAKDFSIPPQLRALRVASPTPFRGRHLRPGGAGSAVSRDWSRVRRAAGAVRRRAPAAGRPSSGGSGSRPSAGAASP